MRQTHGRFSLACVGSQPAPLYYLDLVRENERNSVGRSALAEINGYDEISRGSMDSCRSPP